MHSQLWRRLEYTIDEHAHSRHSVGCGPCIRQRPYIFLPAIVFIVILGQVLLFRSITKTHEIDDSHNMTQGIAPTAETTAHNHLRVFILPILGALHSTDSPPSPLSYHSIHELVQWNVISCIQREMEERRRQQSASDVNSNIKWLIYGINLAHREIVEEVRSWHHFDFVNRLTAIMLRRIVREQSRVEKMTHHHSKFNIHSLRGMCCGT